MRKAIFLSLALFLVSCANHFEPYIADLKKIDQEIQLTLDELDAVDMEKVKEAEHALTPYYRFFRDSVQVADKEFWTTDMNELSSLYKSLQKFSSQRGKLFNAGKKIQEQIQALYHDMDHQLISLEEGKEYYTKETAQYYQWKEKVEKRITKGVVARDTYRDFLPTLDSLKQFYGAQPK